jgi:hypothetical protein
MTDACPAVRTFAEHFLLVVADTADILTGRWRTFSGQRPRSRKATSGRVYGARMYLSEERESPETVEEEPGRAEQPRPATGEAQEGVQRPWWRRIFGG